MNHRSHGSKIVPVDLERACQGRTATDIDDLETYVTTGAGNLLDLIRKVRVVLETHCWTTYPASFRTGQDWLGDIVRKIREGGNQHPARDLYDELDQINEYTSQYHHGEDVADATPDQIDPQELRGCVRRTLRIVNALQALRWRMDLEAYYDSSGRRGHQPATTLAGVAAPKHVWDQFNPLWEKALDENSVPERRFGMADLMASHGGFKGWGHPRKQELLTALLNVLATFRPAGMSVYSCTVFFDAYDAAKAQIPRLRALEAVCVNHCVGGLRLTTERPETQTIELYLLFDRNEPFLKTVDQIWRQLKKRKSGWAQQVQDIRTGTESDYGIQAADLLAWIVNRHRCEASVRGDPQPTSHLSFNDPLDRHAYLFLCTWMMANHHMKVYDDAAQIIEDYGRR